MRTAALSGALLVALAGCASGRSQTTSGASAEPVTVAGHFAFGFESSAFNPCGSPEWWWTTGEMREVGEFISASPRYAPPPNGFPVRTGRVYVRWTGELSGPGSYGHLGGYRRELRVLEVLEVAEAGPPGCPEPA